MDRSQWRFLIKHGSLEEGMATDSRILAKRTPWTIRTGKKLWHQKISLTGQRGPICYWGRVEAITKSSRKKEAGGSKQKSRSVVDVSGDENKVWCCKEQHCIGTGNVRSMNQGKLDVVKQETARVNTHILGISELKWMGMLLLLLLLLLLLSHFSCVQLCVTP